jgi:hypothetical protein
MGTPFLQIYSAKSLCRSKLLCDYFGTHRMSKGSQKALAFARPLRFLLSDQLDRVEHRLSVRIRKLPNRFSYAF